MIVQRKMKTVECLVCISTGGAQALRGPYQPCGGRGLSALPKIMRDF